MHTSAERKVLLIPEFCITYKITKSHLYKLWNESQGPKRLKIGKRVLIRVADADEWLANWTMGV